MAGRPLALADGRLRRGAVWAFDGDEAGDRTQAVVGGLHCISGVLDDGAFALTGNRLPVKNAEPLGARVLLGCGESGHCHLRVVGLN